MWLLYEHPEVTFEGISARFMDIRKRVYEVRKESSKLLSLIMQYL